VNPCEGCHSGCCRSFAVPISGADILRIEREQNLQFWDFACRWADEEGLIAKNFAPHFFFEDEPETPFAICLKYENSVTFPQQTKCLFLEETATSKEHPLGQARCKIYESRPSACRSFPGKLNATLDILLIPEIPQYGREEEHPAYRLCSEPWNPSQLDPVQAMQDSVVAKYEMKFFAQIADVWNRAPGSFSIFPEFLDHIYKNRVQLDEPVERAEDYPSTIKFPQQPPTPEKHRHVA